MLKLLVIILLPVLVRSACNTTTEWTCPQSSKCIPKQYKCDNVPDCTGSVGSPDETDDCQYPPVLSDLRVKVRAFSLRSCDVLWSGPGDKLTNVTVDITYTNGITGNKETTRVYGRPRKCYDFHSSCKTTEEYMCDILPTTKAFCRKLCGVCRVDSMRDNARFDMMSLLDKKAVKISATAFASNFKGDGPRSASVEVPIPEITAVGNLTITIRHKFSDEVWAVLSWNASRFVQHPNIIGSDDSIQHMIKHCRVIEFSNGTTEMADCKSLRPFLDENTRKFYDLKYSTKYAFSVEPVLRYTDLIRGPATTVYLTLPQAPDEGYRINILALSFGVAGGVVFLGIVFVSWRKYQRGEGVCDCDDDDDKFEPQYPPTLAMTAEG